MRDGLIVDGHRMFGDDAVNRKQLFERTCPGAHVECQPLSDPTMRPHLDLLRAEGELKQYTDEELLTDRLIVTWRKPG